MNNRARKIAFAVNALLDAGVAFAFYRSGHGFTPLCEVCIALALVSLSVALFLPTRYRKK